MAKSKGHEEVVYLDASNLAPDHPAGDEKFYVELLRLFRQKKCRVNVFRPIRTVFLRLLFQLFILPFRVPSGATVIFLNKTISPLFFFKRSRIIQIVHCLNFIHTASRLSGISFVIKYCLFIFSLRISDLVIVPSQFVKWELNKYFKAIKNIHVLPYIFKEIKSETCVKKLDRVLVFGKFFKNKNIETAVRVFELIKQEYRNSKLVIAGMTSSLDRDYPGDLRSMLEGSRYFPEDITLHTDVSQEMKEKLIHDSDLVFNLSVYEGFGFVPMECLASNRPVMVTDRVRSVAENIPGYPLMIAYADSRNPDLVLRKVYECLGRKSRIVLRKPLFQECFWRLLNAL